jgi:hypothetical protein
MRKKLRSLPHSLSMMKEMQRLVAQTPDSGQHLRWTLRQQQFLQRQAPQQHRHL